jgi:uncharacterized protein
MIINDKYKLDIMSIDLTSVGMEKGQQYETIITTINKDGSKNAAPIGVICRDKDEILCRIFEDSTTLNNIMFQNEFIVNITLDSILFTLSTTKNISEDFFSESKFNIPILKGVDAYFKCNVIDMKKAIKKSDPVRKSEAKTIIANVEEIILNNKCVKAPNRGFYSLIESLVNFTRIDMVDDEKKDYFIDRFNESRRIINKVGSSEDRKAIKILGKVLNEKGYKTT